MDSPRFEHGAACYPVSVKWLPLTEGKSAERPGMRTEHHYVAVAEKDPRVQRFAQTGGIRDHRVQNRLKIARRFADDAQHLCGSGLLLQRLGKLARALLFGVEQPNVPDRNHRLISERLQQRNLALGKLFSVGSCNRDRSNGVAVKQQRHCHDASIGYCLGETQGTVGGIRLYVRDLGDSAVQYRTADSRVLARWPRKYPPKGLQPLSAQTMTASKVQEIAVEPHHEGELAIAQPHCALGNRVEHRLDVGRRARDDAQDLGGGGLLLQHFSKVLSRFGEFASAYFELPLQVEGVPPSANAGSCLRSGRTKLTAARWALCAFERQGHLVGTVIGPPFRSAQPRIEPINPNRTAR